jgi:type IV secretory pathway VirB6-like protein
MEEQTANQIVTVLLFFTIIGIVLSIHMIFKGTVYDFVWNRLKNNSGNVSAPNMIMMVLSFVLIIGLLYYLVRPKTYHRVRQV